MAKRNLSSILSVAAVAVVALFSGARAACQKPGSGTVAASVASATPASPDDLLSSKLGFYIDCVNLVDPIVTESKTQYLRNLTEDRQIDQKQPPYPSALGGRIDHCFEKIAAGGRTAPRLADVEVAAAAYEAALKQLEPLLVEAARYYNQHDYKDDGFARGLALHPQILAGFAAFFTARGALHQAIDKYNKEILARSVQLIEKKEGKSLHYYSRKVMNDAGSLIDLALDPATDPTRLRDAILAYATTFNENDRSRRRPARRQGQGEELVVVPERRRDAADQLQGARPQHQWPAGAGQGQAGRDHRRRARGRAQALQLDGGAVERAGVPAMRPARRAPPLPPGRAPG